MQTILTRGARIHAVPDLSIHPMPRYLERRRERYDPKPRRPLPASLGAYSQGGRAPIESLEIERAAGVAVPLEREDWRRDDGT
jgi:hypothetical protein